MKKFLLMFAAVAAIAFVGCKPAEEQKTDEAQPTQEEQVAEPTVETVTTDLMKLVEAKDEAGTVAFLDGLKKTAEDFLTAGNNDKYFNIINIIKTVWETNKDKIIEFLPALKDKMEAYITVPDNLKDGFTAFVENAAKEKLNEAGEAIKDAADATVDAAAAKVEEGKEAVKDAVADGADAVKEAVK